MSTWRYAQSLEAINGDEVWAIREIYLNEDGELSSWSVDAVGPGGDSPAETIADLRRMIADSAKSYLDLTVDPPVLVEHVPSAPVSEDPPSQVTLRQVDLRR